MKEIISYKCDGCGRRYDDEQDCEKCERSHIGIDQISCVKYDAGAKYPYFIEVTMNDGRTLGFKRT